MVKSLLKRARQKKGRLTLTVLALVTGLMLALTAWADAADDLVGSYENHLYDNGGKNDWHYATISKIDSTHLKWTNRAGVSWTLTLTSDKTKLTVGSDCPYFTSGYTTASVTFGASGKVTILGPGGEPYDRAASSVVTPPVASPAVAAPVDPDLVYVKQFAPVLLFDSAAANYGYPMNAQDYYSTVMDNKPTTNKPEFLNKALENRGFPTESPNLVTLTYSSPMDTTSTPVATPYTPATTFQKTPTYYETVTLPSGQLRIIYWWFYGLQHSSYEGTKISKLVGPDDVGHNGDWENVMVTLAMDKKSIAAVTFAQHGGHYTRIAGPRDAPCTAPIIPPALAGRCTRSGFEIQDSTHPAVYVSKIAHGSFHEAGGGPAEIQGLYYNDFRKPSDDKKLTWRTSESPFIKMTTGPGAEKWMETAKDCDPKDKNKGNIHWGGDKTIPDGINNQPICQGVSKPYAQRISCTGSAIDSSGSASGGSGCYMSECLAGDDQAAGAKGCLRECEPGYVNMGLTCKKKGFSVKSYKRKAYDYAYTIPSGDAGLTRRRSDVSEYSLP